MGTGTAADLVLDAACESCGGASNLYATACRHATLCPSCGADRARSRARCNVCAAPITNLIREYNVRVDTTADKALSIGRFTTGLPPFSKEKIAGNKWSLRKDGLQGWELTSKIREKYYSRKPWILEDETGEYQYQSQLEGSQSTTATYYLLMMHSKEFHAVPVGSWYNFSKIAQYKQLTLEEAEEKMNRRRNNATGYERWMMKSATQSKKGNKKEDGNQPDKGDDKEEEGAARTNSHGLTTMGMEDEEEGGKEDFDLDDEIEKGDDWEHDDIFSDDDETLDVDPEERADLADYENPAPPEFKQDHNENEQGAGGLSKSGKELKNLLHRNAEQDESDDDDDKDTDEDESPSPVLAPKLKDEFESGPGEDNLAKPTATELANSTRPASRSNQKRRSGGDDAKTSNGAALKKPKIEPETKILGVKEEPPSSLEPVSNETASAIIDTNASTFTEEEIRRVLLAVAPIAMQDLVARFKHRIRTQESVLYLNWTRKKGWPVLEYETSTAKIYGYYLHPKIIKQLHRIYELDKSDGAISVQKEVKGICEHGKLEAITEVGHPCLGGNGHQAGEERTQLSQAPAEHYIQSMFKSKMLPNLLAERENFPIHNIQWSR